MLTLKLPDGSDYGYTGTVEFSQVIVDQSTGTVTIRARFANPMRGGNRRERLRIEDFPISVAGLAEAKDRVLEIGAGTDAVQNLC